MNIRVKPTRPGVEEFIIRINALDFKTLQDRMLRPITILDGVTFNKTVIDRFIEVFRQQIQQNPTYSTEEVTNIFSAIVLTNSLVSQNYVLLFSLEFFRYLIYVLHACKQNRI